MQTPSQKPVGPVIDVVSVLATRPVRKIDGRSRRSTVVTQTINAQYYPEFIGRDLLRDDYMRKLSAAPIEKDVPEVTTRV